MIKRLAQFQFNKNEKGFTLIEMLLVLSIVMVFLVFPTIQTEKIENSQKVKLFIQMFQNDIFLAQKNATISQIPTTIQFYKDKYEVYDNFLNPSIVTRPFDKGIKITFLSLTPPLRFNSDGNISNSGKISISYKGIEYIVTFYLGSGRFSYDRKK